MSNPSNQSARYSSTSVRSAAHFNSNQSLPISRCTSASIHSSAPQPQSNAILSDQQHQPISGGFPSSAPLGYSENPAKVRLKQKHMKHYRDLLGFSQLSVRETPSRDLKVRIQDVENILQSTSAIEQAHRRRNERVESILLANQPACPAKIEYIADTDEKVFYQVHKRSRAKPNNFMLSNPVFNTLYDNVMINRHAAAAATTSGSHMRGNSAPQNNNSNHFRDRQIQYIKESDSCPKKYKEILLEKFHVDDQYDDKPNEAPQQNHSYVGVTLGKKTYQSGMPFYQSHSTFRKQKEVSEQSISSKQQQSRDILNRSLISQKYQQGQQQRSPQQDYLDDSQNNSLNNSRNNSSSRDARLNLYNTFSANQSLIESFQATRNSESFKKVANVNYYEKQAHPYRTYKQARIPRLKLNHYAVENKNPACMWMIPPQLQEEIHQSDK